ncbi:hypothetical protein FEZ41_11645 [Lentilactobacillus parafarraginis]|jgi:DNA-binding protein|uniref:Uncharacterized protein n=1 Tax=Lentilactobacillus parafarraginis TaxID=390842 RepID=A0A5R9CPW1_9LACO|nr:hypothetical protein [Lentilactobacillus parafarraginis]TLQ17415.1 hypothetical protein FEZ41_11645 [Lentilactobacillus parafarraginis]
MTQNSMVKVRPVILKAHGSEVAFAPGYSESARNRFIKLREQVDRAPFDTDAEFELAIEDKLRVDALNDFYANRVTDPFRAKAG